MPNLNTDRSGGVARGCVALNVRRLMYQSLIWAAHLPDEARRLRPALDTKRMERSADPLVDGMRRNAELNRNFFRRQVLVDKEQSVELPLTKPGDARDDSQIGLSGWRRVGSPIITKVCEVALHQHEWPFTAKDEFRQKT